jgi:hypothetical protein
MTKFVEILDEIVYTLRVLLVNVQRPEASAAVGNAFGAIGRHGKRRRTR